MPLRRLGYTTPCYLSDYQRAPVTTSLPPALKFDTEPQRILVVLPTWVGDVVMATPFLASLNQRFADATFTFVMYKHLLQVLAGSPWLANDSEEVMTWPPRDKSPASKQAQRNFIKALQEQQFDLAVLLPNSFRSAWLAFRSGAKRRVGFNRDGRRLLLTDAVEVPNKRPEQKGCTESGPLRAHAVG